MDINMTDLSGLSIGVIVLAVVLLGLLIGAAVVRALAHSDNAGPPITAHGDGRYSVAGKVIACSHCDSDRFTVRAILLNTWLLSLLRFEWLDASATVLMCEKCGKLTWFSQGIDKQ